jgi:hypothetical protein
MSLLELANSRDPSERRIAEGIICELEDTYNDCVIELAIACLEDEDAAMRASALNVIAACSFSWPLEREFAAPVLACLSDRDPRVRGVAIGIAAQTISSYEEAMSSLIACLTDCVADNRDAAFRAILDMDMRVTPASCLLLADYLVHEDETVRNRAGQILMEQGHEELLRGHAGTPLESELAEI